MCDASYRGGTHKPFVLERFYDALGHRYTAVLSYRAKTLCDLPFVQKLLERLPGEIALLVGDDVLGRAVFSESIFDRVDGPTGIGTVQGNGGDYLSGEVIDGHQDEGLK